MQPDTVAVPREQADRILSILMAFEAQLADSPSSWMDDDEIAQRESDRTSVREAYDALAALMH